MTLFLAPHARVIFWKQFNDQSPSPVGRRLFFQGRDWHLHHCCASGLWSHGRPQGTGLWPDVASSIGQARGEARFSQELASRTLGFSDNLHQATTAPITQGCILTQTVYTTVTENGACFSIIWTCLIFFFVVGRGQRACWYWHFIRSIHDSWGRMGQPSGSGFFSLLFAAILGFCSSIVLRAKTVLKPFQTLERLPLGGSVAFSSL